MAHSVLFGVTGITVLSAVSTAMLGAVACSSGPSGYPVPKLEPLSEGTRAELAKLSGTRVYFAHMSVGENVISGLREDLKSAGVSWPVVSAQVSDGDKLSSPPNTPAFFHAWRGANGDPAGKIARFVSDFRGFAEPKPEIALLKLCFADVVGHTDVGSLFAEYKKAVRALQHDFPATRFVHVTVPLSTYPMNWKSRLRRIVGSRPWEDSGNLRRNEYNSLLRKEFASETIFDLARIEATLPDGTRYQFSNGGQNLDALIPDYASDSSGHLNPLGQLVVSRELVKTLASVGSHSSK